MEIKGKPVHKKSEPILGGSLSQLCIFDYPIMAQKPLTLSQLGNKYCVSRERTHQVQVRILQNLKSWLDREIPAFTEEYSDLYQ
jgi:hypothetical protein